MVNRLFLTVAVFLVFIKFYAALNTNFNLFGDEAQYWLWSKSLSFGYFSKPPLLAWVLRVYTEIFGDSFLALKFFSTPVYIITSFVVYGICKNLELSRQDSFSCLDRFFCGRPRYLYIFLL